MLVISFVFTLALPVFADAETTVEETEAVTEVPQETAEETAAETTAKADEPVSDLSNIIGIVAAVIIGIGAVVTVVMLAPKNNAPKKR